MIACPVSPDKAPSANSSAPSIAAAAIAIRDARRAGMNSFHKAVLLALAARLPNIFPGACTLKDDAGVSKSKLYQVLKDLEAWGMVRRSHPADRASTVYELDVDAIRGRPDGGSTPRTRTLPSPQYGQGGVPITDVKGGKSLKVPRGLSAPCAASAGETTRPEGVREKSPHAPVFQPSAGAGHREASDRPDPFERCDLPDVGTPEPTPCEREVSALVRRSERDPKSAVTDPAHLVAVHAVGFERAHGFQPLDLPGAKTWKCAVTAATKLVAEVFRGSLSEAAEYVMWVWNRERKIAEGVRPRNRPVGWRLVFGALVSDYILHVQRQARRAA